MKRGAFLKGMGIDGVVAMLPLGAAKAAVETVNKTTTGCVLAPS